MVALFSIFLSLSSPAYAKEVFFSDPLINAANQGDITLVRRLIASGYPLNKQGEFGATALIRASYKGHHEVVKYLLKKGADPDIQDNGGVTALHFAAREGHPDVVEALVKYSVYGEIPDVEGYTPSMRAILNKRTKVFEILLNNTTDLNKENDSGENIITLSHKSSPRIKDLIDIKIKRATDITTDSKAEDKLEVIQKAVLIDNPSMPDNIISESKKEVIQSEILTKPKVIASNVEAVEKTVAVNKKGGRNSKVLKSLLLLFQKDEAKIKASLITAKEEKKDSTKEESTIIPLKIEGIIESPQKTAISKANAREKETPTVSVLKTDDSKSLGDNITAIKEGMQQGSKDKPVHTFFKKITTILPSIKFTFGKKDKEINADMDGEIIAIDYSFDNHFRQKSSNQIEEKELRRFKITEAIRMDDSKQSSL